MKDPKTDQERIEELRNYITYMQLEHLKSSCVFGIMSLCVGIGMGFILANYLL